MNKAITGKIQQIIVRKLTESFKPVHLEVINESYMHSVPKDSETHFKVIVISNEFDKMTLLDKHRAVQEVLKEQLANGVHALSIVAKTQEQWENNNVVPKSPGCLGGSKHDEKFNKQQKE